MTKQKEKLLKKALDRIESLCNVITVAAAGTITSGHAVWADINGIRTALRLIKITPKIDPLTADFVQTSKYPTA